MALPALDMAFLAHQASSAICLGPRSGTVVPHMAVPDRHSIMAALVLTRGVWRYQAGLPKGVLNVVTGMGPDTGAHL
eukprot:653563-Rhodomonas_salina.1